MKSVVVVNGEQNWQEYFFGVEVYNVKIQTSRWMFTNGELWVFDQSQKIKADAILWRVGAIKPHDNHRTILELIRMSGVPCLNSAKVLLQGYDRISMINELKEAGLPIIESTICIGENILNQVEPQFPCVVKIGNFHGGYGKAKITNSEQWMDFKGLAFVTDLYVTVEPFIDYVRDVRCLAVEEKMWAMSRVGKFWKANALTASYEIIDIPPDIGEYTKSLMKYLAADVLGVDYLEMRSGKFVVLESNDIPGFSGFPDEVKTSVARLLEEKLERQPEIL